MEHTAGSKKELPDPDLLQDDEESQKNSCAVRANENTRKRHPLTDKPLLQTEELYEYVMKTGVYPREPNPLKEIRIASATHPMAYIGTAPDAGQLIAILLKLANSKNTIEIGVFTGYSLLLTALTIPDDGKITAIDIDRKAYEIGLPIITKAGVEHKIDFIESPALPILDKLLENPEKEGSFDFAFVDADKNNYWNYHKRLMKLIKVGGFVVYDNTLWGGTVALPEEDVPEPLRERRLFIIEFNKMVSADPGVEMSLVPLGDGSTICRRIC
ncbi:PREDICTED: probable caffeoyl-CoA O-methyltransferase At4g26220 isoform X2 [Fragaria vesca subsp. vesca]|uniref:probable caffeoyl-CoA O-methyltransferase At4g26220 isoform X2 n=1 Tax=Fragaria vesca subsp. vesca TaxID=101020 RepID=UPI0002C2ECF0|nr:PREDICTED: probable caffeoyl-CoA O-methyltransferase At4g26220 isoform X2 [Fragaria vesca subsp. vesca]